MAFPAHFIYERFHKKASLYDFYNMHLTWFKFPALFVNFQLIFVPAKDSSTFSFDEALRIGDETSVDIFEEV